MIMDKESSKRKTNCYRNWCDLRVIINGGTRCVSVITRYGKYLLIEA